jgi:hypothetical protein
MVIWWAEERGRQREEICHLSENMSWIDETTALSVMEQKDAQSGSVY